ncbi:MAG: PDZ domain-containing protein, partial [Firmicutes bacterium]|nr:PDZ domain-containing protein [Bacillota bacterium]
LKQRFGATRGIYISSVIEGGGAEAAGLKEDDIIVKVNGTEVGTMNKINSIIVGYKDGDTVSVTYLREGQEYTADVRLSTQQ